MNYKILIVDDEPANLNLLERIFSPDHEVIRAGSGPEGLEMLARHDVSLIISDQRMPDMTGIEFLQKASEMRPQCVRIILTGYTDEGSLIDAINSGVVYKYVTKPWVNADLLQTVKRGLSHFETLKAQHQLNTTNVRLLQRIDDTNAVLVRVLMALMNASDPDAEKRAADVRELALKIGKRLSLDGAELRQLALAAYLNEAADFEAGVSGAGDAGKATGVTGEQTILDVLSEVPGLEELVDAITYINEQYDGSGQYGLAGDQIPLYSRIIAIARAFQGNSAADETRQTDDLVEAVRAESGGKFDPAIIEEFVASGLTVPAY